MSYVASEPLYIPLNDDLRFRVITYQFEDGPKRISMTCESRCPWCTDAEHEEFAFPNGRGPGIECRRCDGHVWRSSPDEGTGLPLDKLDELIAVLQRVRADQVTTNDK